MTYNYIIPLSAISELGKFGSVEVKFSVSISGNLCSMRAALWEVNRITKAKVHSCKEYAEGGKNFTNFVVSTETLPYYAVEAAKHVSYGYWYSYGNKFIAKYAPMLKDMIRYASNTIIRPTKINAE